MTTLVILAFLGIILYNLGAGLYYLLVDKGTSNRTVNALTRRIGFSVGLILLVICAGLYMDAQVSRRIIALQREVQKDELGGIQDKSRQARGDGGRVLAS